MRIFKTANSVDEAWYLKQYPDVKAAIAAGKFRSGREHFRDCGRAEGRLPRNPDVDEAWYLATYPDVVSGITDGRFKSAHDHFMQNGFREGRKPTAKSR